MEEYRGLLFFKPPQECCNDQAGCFNIVDSAIMPACYQMVMFKAGVGIRVRLNK